MKAVILIITLSVMVMLCTLLPNSAVASESQYPMTVTDLAGRQVSIPHRPFRVFLGQPRFFYAVMSLTSNPVRHLVGWNYPLSKIDPEIAPALIKAWPSLSHLRSLQSAPSSQISGEGLLALKPDLVVLPLNEKSAIEGSSLASVMRSMQIPWVYVDFDQYPLKDPVKSIKVLGQILGYEKRAMEISHVITQQQDLIASRVAHLKHRPSVLINITPGIKPQCCRTNIRTGMDDIVTAAGGNNIAHSIPSDKATLLGHEWILGHPTEVIINTARQNQYHSGIRMGPGASQKEIQQNLADFIHTMPGWADLPAVKDKRFYAIWHGLHQGPFAVIDLMQVAKWLHPSTFSDLSPMSTFTTLLGPAAPALESGVYWGGLSMTSDTLYSATR